ncbi:MAG: T9SS type A sorting domain-containing protein [Vicingaceae bacterium]|nr:T9SS type A sorting domain-containing protein [Vicingaceae bacterium]
MNIKTIIVGSLAIALALGGTFIKMTSEDTQSVYTPRSFDNGGIRGFAGYAQYMHYLKEDPATGKIDPEAVEQVRREIAARKKSSSNKAALGLNWVNKGPDNVGGRTRAVLVDRNNPNIVYAGSVAGGLFVSTDGTQNWTQVVGHQGTNGENLAISCITQTANGRIFFGTGSDFENFGGNQGYTAGFLGNGVYEYIPSTGAVEPVITNATALPNNTQGSLWSATSAIAAGVGSKGNRLYLGTRDGMVWADPDGNGDYPTTFSGWTNPIFLTSTILEQATCQDIDVAPDGSMVVSFAGKVYTSNSDAPNSFTIHAKGGSSRICAAIAPTNPDVIYLLQTKSNGMLQKLEISLDRGNTWNVIVPPGSPCVDPFVQDACSGATTGQGIYDAAIAVNPSDWGHIIVGGVQLYEWKYNTGSNPVGGSWLKSANLFESIFNPYYVHADKHTIVWPTANTVYIGSDGGVSRSIDGGETWQERNLGFNVTTFLDVATSANGWILGGAQDNGCQLQSFGTFGSITPLGTFEVNGGDGADVAFSNLSGGIAYTTSQNGTILRSNGGQPGTFYDAELGALVATGSQPFHTIIENWERTGDPLSIDSITIRIDSSGYGIAPGDTVYPGDVIPAGDTIWYSSLTNGEPLMYIVPSNITIATPVDSFKLQDPIQNKFVYAASQGVYFTKDAARFNAIDPQWYRLRTGAALCFEFSVDGDNLFVGTASGIIRIGNLSAGNDSLTLDIRSGSAVTTSTTATGISGRVTGIAVDPNNPDNLIATTSGYGSGNKVYRCTNATGALTFTSIQGVGTTALPRMPVYDCEIDYTDNDKVILGTEWGVWTTDNAFSSPASGVDWTDESTGEMSHVPTMGVTQQQLRADQCVNSGVVYLGTHGRGFFSAGELFTGIDDENVVADADNGFISGLEVYPNPMNNQGSIVFNLAERSNAVVKIFNLSGALVKTINLGNKAKGANKANINVTDLSIGSYIVSLEAGAERGIAKFIVTR